MFHRGRILSLTLVLSMVLSALSMLHSPVLAAPAAPVDHDLTQPDGTTFTARQWGDEWLNGWQTTDGYTIMQDPVSSYWVYARRGPDGNLVPVLNGGKILTVGKDSPKGVIEPGETPDLPADSPRYSVDEQRMLGGEVMRQNTLGQELLDDGMRRGQNIGTHRLLMIFVTFQNRNATYPASYFHSLAFAGSNSIRSFYLENSFGKLDLQPAWESQGGVNDGFIELRVSINHPDNTDLSRELANQILSEANPYINFALFDTDGDGTVSSNELHLLFIIAGYEDSYGGANPGIWAHQWYLINNLMLDGKRVATPSPDGDYGGYFMFGEIHWDHPATRGVMIHELGHDLSWPDLYDTDAGNSGGASEGVGDWSIMGGGSWNKVNIDGDAPSAADAYLKYYQGWISPRAVVNGTQVLLRRGDQYPDALMLGYNANGVDWDFTKRTGTGEYFLVETRRELGLPDGACGILVWHVDETRTSANTANANPARMLLKLVQADGWDDLRYGSNRGDTGDPFPGWYGVNSINDTTDPNLRYYSGAYSNRGLVINTTDNTRCHDMMYVTYSAPAQPHRYFLPNTFR